MSSPFPPLSTNSPLCPEKLTEFVLWTEMAWRTLEHAELGAWWFESK